MQINFPILTMIDSYRAILIYFLFLILSPIDSYSQLRLNVTNIDPIEGHIIYGLYDDPEVFLEEEKEFHVGKIEAKANSQWITIDSLPAGTYAFSIYHDINSNGEMETNFIGFPQEPYGFSNNYDPKLRAPRFSDAQFEYDGVFLELAIRMVD